MQVRAALEASGLDHGPISVHDKMRAMGLDPVPSDRVAGADLPRGRRRPGRAEEEAALGVAPVRLSGTERVLAAGRHRVRADRRTQVRDLPAHRRPLPLRGRLPRRVGRDRRGRDRGVRQGRRRPRCSATAAVRQRDRAEPVAARLPRPARRTPLPPRRRSDHRQALQADHPGQERALPPDPVPLPRQAATGRRAGRSSRPRSTRSTASTTPNAPTRGCPAGSPPARHGRPPRRPRLPVPSPTRRFFVRAQQSPGRRRCPQTSPPAPLVRTLTTAGTFRLAGVTYKVAGRRALEQVLVITDGDTITVADLDGEILIEHTRPAPGVSLRRQRQTPRHAPQDPNNRHRSPDTPTVTDVLMQNCHRCPETSHSRCRPHPVGFEQVFEPGRWGQGWGHGGQVDRR